MTCNHCNTDSAFKGAGIPLAYEDFDVEIGIENNSLWIEVTDTDENPKTRSIDFEILYCPWCGEHLRKPNGRY